MSKKCCGMIFSEQEKFCTVCGKPLEDVPETEDSVAGDISLIKIPTELDDASADNAVDDMKDKKIDELKASLTKEKEAEIRERVVQEEILRNKTVDASSSDSLADTELEEKNIEELPKDKEETQKVTDDTADDLREAELMAEDIAKQVKEEKLSVETVKKEMDDTTEEEIAAKDFGKASGEQVQKEDNAQALKSENKHQEEDDDDEPEEASKFLKFFGTFSWFLMILGLAFIGLVVYFLIVSPVYDKAGKANEPLIFAEVPTETDASITEMRPPFIVASSTDAMASETDAEVGTGDNADSNVEDAEGEVE